MSKEMKSGKYLRVAERIISSRSVRKIISLKVDEGDVETETSRRRGYEENSAFTSSFS